MSVSVVIPTLGRPQLRATLDSLAACDPPPAEVVVVGVRPGAVEPSVLGGARLVDQTRRGRANALNEGIRAAAHDLVAVTDDDCTVRPDWIAVVERELGDDPSQMICGQVLPAGGDPRLVPSTIVFEHGTDYTGQLRCDVLYGGNFACSRDAVLALGGFDERVVPTAEDCDLCYRWLRSGRALRHVPEMVIWHHDWRTPQELDERHVEYYQGLAAFYGIHLRRGDPRVLRFLARDLYAGARGALAGRLRGTPRWADERRGAFRGLLSASWRAPRS